MEKEKEKKANPATDALLGVKVIGSDKDVYKVIGALKKLFNAKTESEEGISVGKIDNCMCIGGEALSSAPMYGAARFLELYDFDNIGHIFGEMRDDAEFQKAIEKLEKYTFTFFLGGSPSFAKCVYGVRHDAGTPIEDLVTVRIPVPGV